MDAQYRETRENLGRREFLKYLGVLVSGFPTGVLSKKRNTKKEEKYKLVEIMLNAASAQQRLYRYSETRGIDEKTALERLKRSVSYPYMKNARTRYALAREIAGSRVDVSLFPEELPYSSKCIEKMLEIIDSTRDCL